MSATLDIKHKNYIPESKTCLQFLKILKQYMKTIIKSIVYISQLSIQTEFQYSLDLNLR